MTLAAAALLTQAEAASGAMSSPNSAATRRRMRQQTLRVFACSVPARGGEIGVGGTAEDDARARQRTVPARRTSSEITDRYVL